MAVTCADQTGVRAINPLKGTIMHSTTDRYAKVIEVSKRVRWDIDRDLIRGRSFDYSRSFLPDGLSLVNELDFLSPADQRLLSQVQGRTYAYLFGVAERFVATKAMELGHAQAFGDQVALEALVRMTDEELKHQKLFRQLEWMMAADMPAGYTKTTDPDELAHSILGRRTWAVLALILDLELFTQAHYRASIQPDDRLCPLWKDVFLFHWKEESQHAILDELEFMKENARVSSAERDAGVDDLIALVGTIDEMVQAQAAADAIYFCRIAKLSGDAARVERIKEAILKAYRWQYIVSGVAETRFQKLLFSLLDESQIARIGNALAPLTYAVPQRPEDAMKMAA
jgi:hypothetical protein